MKISKKFAALLLTTSCLAFANTSLFADAGTIKIETEHAPKAIGPYSQAVVAGSYMFLSGQVAIDPTVGKLTAVGIEEQTKQVLKNLEAVLAANGLTFENVVKTSVFLKDLGDFAAMNGIYGTAFTYPVKPARATVQVSKLPLDALVEIECVAFIPCGK